MQRHLKIETTNYEEGLHERLRKPTYAAEYLRSFMDIENDVNGFLLALKDVCAAWGIGQLAQSIKVNRQSLYKALSQGGNPGYKTISSLLNNMGLQLVVQPLSRGYVSKVAGHSDRKKRRMG